MKVKVNEILVNLGIFSTVDELEVHKEYTKSGYGVSIWVPDQFFADELLKQAKHSDRLADWLNSIDLHDYSLPIDTKALRGVCDLRYNNLDYWRNTARKFLPLAADHIDVLTQRAESAEAEVARLKPALQEALEFINAIVGLYGESLTVANWHQNGDHEPFDNFIDENGGHDVLDHCRRALAKGEGADDGKDHS